MSENFTWGEQLKTNFKINLLFSILWANPQGVTRAQMSQISGDGPQFQFESLHCEEITKASKELNVRKGMGHDRIPNSILRLGSEELAPSLTTILIQ